jgi:hypothetical protein
LVKIQLELNCRELNNLNNDGVANRESNLKINMNPLYDTAGKVHTEFIQTKLWDGVVIHTVMGVELLTCSFDINVTKVWIELFTILFPCLHFTNISFEQCSITSAI